MIEISHQQARYLIRQGSDGRRLPDEQWAILQSHLENCADCRDYRQRLSQAAHDLRRDLQMRWNPVPGPRKAQHEPVLQYRINRKKWRRAGVYTGVVLLFVFMLWIYSTYRRLTAPPPIPTPVAAAVVNAQPTPTIPPVTFRGMLAYESFQDGSSEIYLLNLAGGADRAEQINLTDHPANDFSPAWSPDGEWLAFLSDRSGRPEVYVMHVAGSRLTQLTDDPTIGWRGPLSWSHDGQWLALTGQPHLSGKSWVYYVPLDGSGPSSIAFSQNASAGVQFSPTQPVVVYGINRSFFGGLFAYSPDTAFEHFLLTDGDTSAGMHTGLPGSFEWSPDGRKVAYLAQGRYNAFSGELMGLPEVQVKVTQEMNVGSVNYIPFDTRNNLLLETVPAQAMLRGISWVPQEAGRVLAFLQDEGGDGCWKIYLRSATDSSSPSRAFSDLCVEGSLGRQNWLPDSTWLVLLGREPQDDSLGYYALRVPRNLSVGMPSRVERLMDVDWNLEFGPDLPDPRVRPAGQPLNIQPSAVAPFVPLLPPPPQPTDSPGASSITVMRAPGRACTSSARGRTARTR
jgi:hypothetical protein